MNDWQADDEQLTLHSSAQFKALGHPVRQRMMNVLRQRPATLAELTAALGSTKGTIAYHVRVLREAGLIRLAYTRQVRGGTEQYFTRAGGAIRLPQEMGAEFLFKEALAEMAPVRPSRPQHTVLQHLWLTAEEADALATRIKEFADAHRESDGSRGEPYGMLLSLYPADIPALPPES
ncbi:winged helix-turn-helix domain-containing protein [Nonomuraea sp. NPDC049152]|uniref:ArsR/SmtB family transcription factor n=1 Tax=Nonomuraea sp. NPDC049152 TaxID=3154350 RepID=UPI0033FDECCC